jgi:hypothetical protein
MPFLWIRKTAGDLKTLSVGAGKVAGALMSDA